MEQQTKDAIIKLIENSRDAIACSIDSDGFPNAKNMFKLKHEGLKTFWFSTNTSAIRTSQWMHNSKSCIYFLDAEGFHGLMLTGHMKVFLDDETKQKFWKEGDEQYYPLGPTDPDYCMLCFTAEKGNYYHGLQRHLFSVEELQEYNPHAL